VANKETVKLPVNRTRFDEALKLRHSSIRKLGEAYDEIARTEKTIRRCLQQDEMSPDLLDRIGKFLDVDPDYISGKYDREIDKIKDKHLRSVLAAQLKAEKYPYLVKQQAKRFDGKFLYDKYLESILIIHDISLRQFKALPFEQQKSLQMDMEDAITSMIAKYFTCDAKGREGLPSLQYLYAMIDCYDPVEPEFSDDFDMELHDEDVLDKKYANYRAGESDNEN